MCPTDSDVYPGEKEQSTGSDRRYPVVTPQGTAPHHTFIPGIGKQVISGAGALLAALIRDGEEGCGGHRLRAAAVVAPLVCTPRGLGVNTASAAAPLGERRRSTVTVGDILGLL